LTTKVTSYPVDLIEKTEVNPAVADKLLHLCNLRFAPLMVQNGLLDHLLDFLAENPAALRAMSGSKSRAPESPAVVTICTTGDSNLK
jgi:hypothetical protein